jgi:hypothetical protein
LYFDSIARTLLLLCSRLLEKLDNFEEYVLYLFNMTSSSSGADRLGMASRCCSLVVLLALAAVLTLAPTASAAGGAARFQKPYNVCTSDWSPIVSVQL